MMADHPAKASAATRKGRVGRIASTVLFMIAGLTSGILIMRCIDVTVPDGAPHAYPSLLFAFLVVWMYTAFLLETVIHEAGHLIFGLLTGYSFFSFRIGSFAWVKSGDRIHFARQSIAGTAGQCLMSPPDMVDGTMPVVLYNYGGVIMNVVSAAIFLLLSRLFSGHPVVSTMLALPAVVGLIMAAMNGMPLTIGDVDNDGRNALAMSKSPRAQRAFWAQLKASEMTARGIRVKDMPEEWFEVPSDEDMTNSITATACPFASSRLMDEHRFEEADALMKRMLENPNSLSGIYRGLLVNDRLFVELIGENRPDVLAEMRTAEQEKFAVVMREYPSVIRTEYAYALLHEHDAKKVEELSRRFEKVAASHPYPSDIESERELMALADAAAQLD